MELPKRHARGGGRHPGRCRRHRFSEFSFLSAYELKVGRGWENLEDQTNWVRRIRSFTRRHGVYLFVNHPAIVAEAGTTNRYNQT